MEKTDNKTLLSWSAPEFVYYAKTRAWFIGLGIIAAGLFILAILIKNYFFALLVPVAAFLIYVHAQKRPRRIAITVTDEAINIGEHLSLAHKEIISFWIFEETDIKILSLETKKILQPKIALLLEKQEPAIIRETLKNFVKEKKQEEYFTDIIAKRLKF